MNELDEIHNVPTGNSPSAVASVSEPMDVQAAIGQLRILVCGLGAGLVIVSLALTAFVFKQNRNLAATIAVRQHQLSQLQANGQVLDYVVNELAKYSAGKPELTAIFTKHGVQVTPTAGTFPPKN